MANIYKTFTKSDVVNKPTQSTNSTQNQKISDSIEKFVTLFKAKHL